MTSSNKGRTSSFLNHGAEGSLQREALRVLEGLNYYLCTWGGPETKIFKFW